MCKVPIYQPELVKGIGIIHPDDYRGPENSLIGAHRRRTKNTSAFKTAKAVSTAGTTATLVFDLPPSPGDTMFVNMRNGNSSALISYPGWTLLGFASSSLYTLVRIADNTDTNSYPFTFNGNVNNFNLQAVMISGTVGYQGYLMTTVNNSLTPTSPSYSITKNSTMLYYFSTAGSANGATSASIPAGYTAILTSGFNLQTTYQTFSDFATSSWTVTFSPGTGPATTRIVRIEILGAT